MKPSVKYAGNGQNTKRKEKKKKKKKEEKKKERNKITHVALGGVLKRDGRGVRLKNDVLKKKILAIEEGV